MLVLTRKVGEQIVLPNRGITIHVLGIAGSKVRLGFAAPPDTRVHRLEIWHRIRGSLDGQPCQTRVGE
jgi:carbon storage regulator